MSSAPDIPKDWKASGSDKIAPKEPLYVFAVNDDLTAKLQAK
jgi:hypothetical protein